VRASPLWAPGDVAGEVTIRDLRSDDFEQTQRRVARARSFVVAILTKSEMSKNLESTSMRDCCALASRERRRHAGECLRWVAKRRETANT